MSSDFLDISNIEFSYPGSSVSSLHEISLSVKRSHILSLIGKSGSGKSTLLRVIAGFEKPFSGSVTLDGQSLTSSNSFVRPERRDIGFVSQTGDLFPHLSIASNIAYGLAGSTKNHQALIAHLLASVQLSGYEKKYPSELSGGERQRIALVRALALKPRLLLLDEPFSSLDSHLRKELLELTFGLLKKENMTAIFVTHHSQDALRVGDSIGVMLDGRLVQVASPPEIWKSPANEQVARLLHDLNDYSQLTPAIREKLGLSEWGKTEDLIIHEANTPDTLTAKITRVEFLGKDKLYTLQPADCVACLKALAPASKELQVGEEVSIGKQ